MLTDIRVSHVLPVRNGEQHLVKCLESILRNCDAKDEIVVINDGSSDATSEILRNFNFQDVRIRIENTSGIGLVGALNLGFKIASAEWIARYDVDDVYSHRRIQTQFTLISSDIGVIFGDYSFHDDRMKYLGYMPSPITNFGCLISLLYSQQTAHPLALINRKYFLKVNGYREEDFPAEDLSLWIRLSSVAKIVSVPDLILSYRLSPSSTSGSRQKIVKKKKDLLIGAWKLSPISKSEVRDEISRIKKIYQGTPESSLRTILFYRNLNAFLLKTRMPRFLIISARIKFISFLITHLFVLIKPFFYMILRKGTRLGI